MQHDNVAVGAGLRRSARRREELGRGRVWRAVERAIGVAIGVAIVALVAVVIVGPSVIAPVCRGGDRAMRTQLDEERWLQVVYVAWRVDHPERACPSSLRELAEGEDVTQAMDAWGRPLVLGCEPQRVEARSAGPDGWFHTDDDVVVCVGRRCR